MAVLALALARQCLAQGRPVDGVDDVEQRHCLTRLIGLQGANQVQFDLREPLPQGRPLVLAFLHPVLAVHLLAGQDDLLDDLGGHGLGCRHESDRRHVPAGARARVRERAPDCCQACRRIVVGSAAGGGHCVSPYRLRLPVTAAGPPRHVAGRGSEVQSPVLGVQWLAGCDGGASARQPGPDLIPEITEVAGRIGVQRF